VRQLHQAVAAAVHQGDLLVQVHRGLAAARGFLFHLALQRRALAGAALVDEDQVAALVQARIARRDQRQHLRRGLAGPAGQQGDRVGQLVARQRRHQHHAQRDGPALRLGRVERALQRAALQLGRVAVEAAGLERQRCGGGGLGVRAARQQGGQHAHQQRGRGAKATVAKGSHQGSQVERGAHCGRTVRGARAGIRRMEDAGVEPTARRHEWPRER
jgi:hypothetical protein